MVVEDVLYHQKVENHGCIYFVLEEFESGFSKQQSSSKTDVADFDEHWFVQHCHQVFHYF